MNGLDLFSGSGGITLAIKDYVRPIAYCEIDKYCQAVLLSRMVDGLLPEAPIWDDIQTLQANEFPSGAIDIIYGGFPCQDISVAGRGKGLGGKRSGLFFEIIRLAKEIKPKFVFLENVPAIRTRGLDTVIQEFTEIGYDLRWTMLSAKAVGAPHKRDRWFMLAARRSTYGSNTEHNGRYGSALTGSPGETICDNAEGQDCTSEFEGVGSSDLLAYTMRERLQGQREISSGVSEKYNDTCDNSWWEVEPSVGRVVDGCPARVDRIKTLGNGVVPLQVKIAFEYLIGLKENVIVGHHIPAGSGVRRFQKMIVGSNQEYVELMAKKEGESTLAQ
jgi:DNA (cytosine-5)-methyltransferase 1